MKTYSTSGRSSAGAGKTAKAVLAGLLAASGLLVVPTQAQASVGSSWQAYGTYLSLATCQERLRFAVQTTPAIDYRCNQVVGPPPFRHAYKGWLLMPS